MERHTFEDMCRGARLRPVKRVDVPGGVILIADSGGLSLRDLRATPQNGKRHHFCTLWAYGKDENTLEIGQSLYFDAFYEDDGLWKAATEDVRVTAAEQTARKWLDARRTQH